MSWAVSPGTSRYTVHGRKNAMDLLQLLSFGDTGWGMALLKAAGMTVLLTLTALLWGAFAGSAVAAANRSHGRLFRYLGDIYSILFRVIPELLVIYLFYFGGARVMGAINHWFGGGGLVG